MTQAKSLENYLTEARDSITTLNVEQAREQLNASQVTALDVRDKNELIENGAIPGAIHASRGMLEFLADPQSPYHDKRLSPGMKVLVYCASGGRSALAAARLQEMGYDASSMDGGFRAWVDAGYDTAKSD